MDDSELDFTKQKHKMNDLMKVFSLKRQRNPVQTILVFQVTERRIWCTYPDWSLETFQTEEQANKFIAQPTLLSKIGTASSENQNFNTIFQETA